MKVYKIYLVQFYYEGERYYKCGVTKHIDVMDRFRYDIRKYNLEQFRVIKSGYLKGLIEEDTKEDQLFKLIMKTFPENNYVCKKTKKAFFHNNWFKEKINGVTEMRKYNQKEVNFAKDFVINNSELTYRGLFNG
tara:strand:+ start:181 stop:582 length:402 start_codon:yes stop_codon:yes gene_type:complete